MSTSMDADSIREAYEDVRNDTSEVQWYAKISVLKIWSQNNFYWFVFRFNRWRLHRLLKCHQVSEI